MHKYTLGIDASKQTNKTIEREKLCPSVRIKNHLNSEESSKALITF